MKNNVKENTGEFGRKKRKKNSLEIEDGRELGKRKGRLWGSRERGELGKISKAGTKPVAK